MEMIRNKTLYIWSKHCLISYVQVLGLNNEKKKKQHDEALLSLPKQEAHKLFNYI